MDLTSGFYNIIVSEEDRKFTAFTTPMGLYEFNRLPQGLCNSPASFMRLMTNIFRDQNFFTLLCYLDDLLVYASNEEEAIKRLELVFTRLRAHGLKLAPKKCHFLRRSVKFLGHIIDKTGVATDPDKWEVGTADRAIQWLTQDIHQLLSPGPSPLPVFSLSELQQRQQDDKVLSRVLFYVSRGKRLSRRERAGETFEVLKTLKQWEKLKMLDRVLYRVSKDVLMGKKRWQYVVPASLVTQVLQGIHNEAGHQETNLLNKWQRYYGTSFSVFSASQKGSIRIKVPTLRAN
ncbi:interleukin-1 receptor accessory -like 1-A isoform X3 [Labeo rohita]|uniref:ribonuclease H n=1 Tax=Labeo rohita TaxID=84645 RepID=A0A498MLK7_LABRO|nr:interleukin-1 receptor accessory -like 1-A isoform X3 [Labeo rohita]